MDEAQAFEQVKKVVVEQLGVNAEEVTREASFVDTVELVMALEESFSTEIPDEEAEKIRTVGDTVNYILAHAKK